MFERFLKRARDRSRYLNGPFVAERERYMAHLCSEGRTEGVLAEINGLLLTIAERIDVLAGSNNALHPTGRHDVRRMPGGGSSRLAARG